MTVFALVDCNNFFVSCERVFQPRLWGKPTVVLSNNDGNIIARSNEAKVLGIKMGEPLFKARYTVEQHQVQVFSANFVLYGDMSHRVMHTLEQFTPDMEIYSIDEAFLDLTGFQSRNLDAYGREIKKTVGQWTKIPVSVGIAETKTLAKVAAELAKKSDKAQGVLDLTGNLRYREIALSRLPVRDVWGVGGKIAEALYQKQIKTALDLANADDDWLFKRFSTVLMRTVYELRGISCIPLDQSPPPKKSIMTSRSFANCIEDLPSLKQMVAGYAARAGEKLREEGLAAKELQVFIQTNRFRQDVPQYRNGFGLTLPVATQATPELIEAAHRGLEQIFRHGYAYHKAGVMVMDLVPANNIQPSLLETIEDSFQREQWASLMHVVDRINLKASGNILRMGAEGIQKRWRMRQEHRSADFTSAWGDLPVVRA